VLTLPFPSPCRYPKAFLPPSSLPRISSMIREQITSSKKAALFKIAASQLPTYFVSGCLFLVQTQLEYDALPLHIGTGFSSHPTTYCDPPYCPRRWGYHASARDLCTQPGFLRSIGSRAGSPENGHYRKHFACRSSGLARSRARGTFSLTFPRFWRMLP
jgi:hypothetical protein